MAVTPRFRVDEFTRRRYEAGLSNSQVARKLGVDKSTVSNLLAGRRQPNAGLVKKIADLFGVPIATLLDFGPHPADPDHDGADCPCSRQATG